MLRGLGAERVQVLTNGIGVIDASAASPDHQVAADGIDAEKIEILRGPAALAYGGQAIGGVVNVIDGLIVETRPEEAGTGEVFAAYNDVNEGTEGGRPRAFLRGGSGLHAVGIHPRFRDYDIPGFAESAGLRALEDAEHGDEEVHGEEDGHDEDHDEDHGHDEHGEDEEHDHGHDEEETRGMLENSFVETATLAGGLSWVGERASFGVAVRRQDADTACPATAMAMAGTAMGKTDMARRPTTKTVMARKGTARKSTKTRSMAMRVMANMARKTPSSTSNRHGSICAGASMSITDFSKISSPPHHSPIMSIPSSRPRASLARFTSPTVSRRGWNSVMPSAS